MTKHLLATVSIRVWGVTPDDDDEAEKLVEEIDSDLDAGAHAVAAAVVERFVDKIPLLEAKVSDE